MRAVVLVIACLFFTAGPAVGAPAYQDVSVADLLHDPAAYAGKRVRVHGFLIVQFEGNSIWADEVAFRTGQYDRGFWVDTRSLPRDEAERLSGRLAYVSGTLDLESRGHLGLWSGAIEPVTLIQSDPADTLESRPWKTEPFVALLIALTVIGGLVVAIFLLGKRTWLLKRPATGAYKPPHYL